MEVPFPGGCPVVDACKDVSVGDCPIETGETFDYKMTMKIESFFPAVSIIMEDPGICRTFLRTKYLYILIDKSNLIFFVLGFSFGKMDIAISR